MPHQCVACNTFYDDGSTNIIKGCACGGKLFYYIKKEKLADVRKNFETLPKLTSVQQKEIEQDVRKIIGDERGDTPVILDIENVKVLQPGKYELDLVQLFKGAPPVFKLEEGKYFIDLAETFRRFRR